MTKLQKSFDTVEVGKRIKQLRKARSLKQDDLMEALKKSLTQVQRPKTNRTTKTKQSVKKAQ